MDVLMAAADHGRQKTARKPTEKPWVEKYRPKSVDEVAYQNEVVSVLKNCLTGGDMPHLLFYGPPGTGKTSTILAIARQLYGPDMLKDRLLELNASDERGINVVREKVKRFAQSTATAVNKNTDYPCPPYKIIVLDEADAMTGHAQAALRRTIENHSKVTRFCIICNYVSRIIEPLASRCAKFRFKPLNEATQLTRLREICTAEEVQCSDHVLKRLIELAEGDLRHSITFLQSAQKLKADQEILVEDVENIAGVLPQARMDALLAQFKINSFEPLQRLVEDIIADGYSAFQVISQVHDAVVFDQAINDEQKGKITEKIAEVDKNLLDGASESLQLLDLAAVAMKTLSSQ